MTQKKKKKDQAANEFVPPKQDQPRINKKSLFAILSVSLISLASLGIFFTPLYYDGKIDYEKKRMNVLNFKQDLMRDEMRETQRNQDQAQLMRNYIVTLHVLKTNPEILKRYEEEMFSLFHASLIGMHTQAFGYPSNDQIKEIEKIKDTEKIAKLYFDLLKKAKETYIKTQKEKEEHHMIAETAEKRRVWLLLIFGVINSFGLVFSVFATLFKDKNDQ